MDSLPPEPPPVPEPSVQDDAERPDAPNILEHVEAQRLSPYARVALLIEICEQMERLHDEGGAHRLLRPDLILITAEVRPEIVDGLSEVHAGLTVEHLLSDVSRLTDTVPYLSPEQLDDGLERGDARSDVYALGVIGFEMLTGRPPRGLSPMTRGDVTQIVPEETAARLGVIDRRSPRVGRRLRPRASRRAGSRGAAGSAHGAGANWMATTRAPAHRGGHRRGGGDGGDVLVGEPGAGGAV